MSAAIETKAEPVKTKRGAPSKPEEERKQSNLTFRIGNKTKAVLEDSAKAAHRSVSAQITFIIEQHFEWVRAHESLEKFGQELAESRKRLAQAEQESLAAIRQRTGWGKIHDPAAPEGVRHYPPGQHNIPSGGFEPTDAASLTGKVETPPALVLAPALQAAVRSEVQDIVRMEMQVGMQAGMQAAVRAVLEEIGLVSRPQK
jgi:hypothetical protein